jgi:hypothetical protein
MRTATFSTQNPMTLNLLAALASGLLLATLVVLASLDTDPEERNPTELLTLRELAMAPPPPPPPSPPVRKQQSATTPALQLSSANNGPALAVPRLQVDETLAQIDVTKPAEQQQTLDWERELAVDWSAFGLGELDNAPRVISTPSIAFPTALTRRHIHSALVRLDVFIDENGSVTLVAIAENPYPELEPVIRRIVRATRFTTPLKDGQPVRARFTWPLEIKA